LSIVELVISELVISELVISELAKVESVDRVGTISKGPIMLTLYADILSDGAAWICASSMCCNDAGKIVFRLPA